MTLTFGDVRREWHVAVFIKCHVVELRVRGERGGVDGGALAAAVGGRAAHARQRRLVLLAHRRATARRRLAHRVRWRAAALLLRLSVKRSTWNEFMYVLRTPARLVRVTVRVFLAVCMCKR